MRLAYALEVDNVPGSSVLFPVLEDGSMLTEAPLVTRPVRQPRDENGVVQYISLESLEPRAMSQMWNEVLTEGREETVIAAMRILEPSLNTIVFLAGDRAFRFGRGGILIGFEKDSKRVPLEVTARGCVGFLRFGISDPC